MIEKAWNRIYAEGASLASAAGGVAPAILTRFGHEGNSIRWQINRLQSAAEITESISEGFPSESSRIPKGYGGLAVFTMDEQAMNERPIGTRQAVAYGKGDIAIMGYGRFGQDIFRVDPRTGESQIAMRIGKGPLEAGIGFVAAGGSKLFTPLNYTMLSVEVIEPGQNRPDVPII